MTPAREEIIQALENPTPNPLAEAVGDAVRRYAAEFSAAVRDNAGFAQTIRLTAPTNETESFAFQLFVEELKANMPATKIAIRG
jgi:hypothetical protein